MKDAKIDNNIRVFVDEPIGNINDDEFGHRHYVDVIKNIIDNCQNEQLNIGLFGKWGVGKTTIINLLKNRIDNSEEYKTVMFECWKYSNEPISLKRKFLLEVAKQTGEPVDELIESLYIKGNRQINNQSILKSESNLKKSIKGMFKGLLFSSVIILFAEVIFYLFLLSRLHIEGQISIPLFFNAIVAGVIYYVVKILKDYTSNVTITKSNENLESLEQFEKSFQKLINDFANKKSNKIIIFVDDLDRCQSKKVIEALETIKTFMNIKNCIFIIACDDAVLKKALIEEKIDDTDYLDKIFQIKLAIPPFRQEKIRDFTIKLLSSIDIDIPKEELKEIVHVLIYKNVMSPRKVKILLNNFILLYGIFKERLQENYFSANFTLDLKFLAKITVLQTEFTQLYYDLVNNNRLLEYVERVRRGDNDFEESQINILSKYYCVEEEQEFRVKDEFKEAIEYLYYTSNYIVSREHIKTYIYLSQDMLNISYSDEYVENLENLIINKDINGFVTEINKTKSHAERIEIFNNLLLRIDKYENLDMINILSSLSDLNIVRLIPEGIKHQFASIILNKIQQYKNNIKQFSINGVVNYISITEHYNYYSDIINEYVNTLALDNLNYTNNVLNTICMNSNLSFNINPLDRVLVKLYEKDYKEVLRIISKINDNQKSLEKYFSGDIFETIMDFKEEYSEDDKKIISRYLLNISEKLIYDNHNLLTEKILNYINDDNSELSSTCIEILDSILNLDKDISKYATNIVDALSLEANKWKDEDTCNKIFNLIIKVGEGYEINSKSKEKLVTRLCEYYIGESEVFISSYINAVCKIVRVYGNIDRIVQNIVQVINSLVITSNSSKYLVKYINGVKEYINSTQRNTIMQNILNLLNNQNNQINKNIMEFLYSLLRQCSFIIEPDKINQLSNSLIYIANSQQRTPNPVNEEIIKLTYTIYNNLMHLFNVDDLKNQYFSSILSKIESNLIYDFAVKQFIQNYTILSDNNIRQRILYNIISKDCKEINNNPQKIIEILIYYGSETINQLLDAVFNFINKKFIMTDKINNLCEITSKLEFTNKDVELRIILSMYSIFEKEVQKNVFNNLLFNERSVRENTIKLFIEGKVDNKYQYTLNTVSEKIDSEEERMYYYSLIEDKIKNTSSEIEINNLLQLFVALKDNNNYLVANKINDIINNTFIYLLEGGLAQKKAALDTLTLYYNQKKFPRGMSSKLAKILYNIAKNNEEIREKAIYVLINSGLYKMRGINNSEFKDIIEKYSKTGTED